MIGVIAAALAFWLGYSVNQSGTCLVSAAHEVVYRRRARRVVGLAIASLAAGLVAIPLAWSPLGAKLVGSIGMSLSLLCGAIAFGLGALINDACLLGSLGRLGNGESRLLALPLGLATGFLVTLGFYKPKFEVQPSVLSSPNPVTLIVLASFLAALIVLIALLRRSARKALGARTAAMSMVVLGLSGGALYGLMPSWAYTDLLLAHLPFGLGKTEDAALATVLAAIAGAIFSAYLKRTWRPRGASLRQLGKTFAGGALMGAGVALIPGGNDSLILAAIPALSSSGIVAYLVMFLVISLAMILARPKAAPPAGVE